MTPLERFERHRDWATRHAYRFRFPQSILERGDVLTAALTGLWKACLKLESDRSDDEFRRRAWTWVRGEVSQLIRDSNWVKRSQRLAGVRIELLYEVNWELLVAPENDTSFDLEAALAAVERLQPLDRRVLEAHCRADPGDGTMTRLAREMGVSQPRLSQRLRRAIDTLRAELLKTA
jgi:RNA polymerase sigma factor (sigma-70 family)